MVMLKRNERLNIKYNEKYGLFATNIMHLFSNLFALNRTNNLANNFGIYLDLDLKILPKKQLIHR